MSNRKLLLSLLTLLSFLFLYRLARAYSVHELADTSLLPPAPSPHPTIMDEYPLGRSSVSEPGGPTDAALKPAEFRRSAVGPTTSPNAKKGFEVVVRPDGNWLRQVTALHAHWFYSWGGDEPKNMPPGVEFVPMAWGYYGNKDNGHVKWLAKVKAQPNIHALLGFNEPDGKDQANLSVDGALEGWQWMMQTGLPLGSPAAVHADNDWMKGFMRGVEEKHYRVDFVTIHWYGGNDPQGFLGYLATIHNLYHRPLWITEFAPADWSGHRGITPQQSADFMRVVLPEMNKRDYVARYAWFSAGTGDAALGASALFNNDGSLTELGRVYAAL